MSKYPWRPKVKNRYGEVVREIVHKDCERCKRKFWARHPNAKFCFECRGYMPISEHKIKCEQCGTMFTAKNSNARLCSHKCRTASYRARLAVAMSDRGEPTAH